MAGGKIVSWLFHQLCVRHAQPPTYADEEYEVAMARNIESTDIFFRRLGDQVNVSGMAVLDVGCGNGALRIEAARQGANRVVGIDIQPLDWARQNLEERHPELVDRVEFLRTDGSLGELGTETF